MALVNGGYLYLYGHAEILENSYFSETADQILKKVHRDVPWVTLLKTCSRNFDLPRNMAQVNWGYNMEMKNFLKIHLLWNPWSDFKIISKQCSLGDHFQKCLRNSDPSRNMALVNGVHLHYSDMKKFLKILLHWNGWSDFEMISQRCPLCVPFQKLSGASIGMQWHCFSKFQVIEVTNDIHLILFWVYYVRLYANMDILKKKKNEKI